ncbi:solute carrier family 12 member 2-like protein [Leptotrombidium deliense]|uniref:Solute carrier family 12 member 3 n=1 Tax=Leptotrombidium deliense TaxID=299467 RepID=A0A443SDS0_9ACAR|nr:solute carrier family 12 member 2-like protein [Leptotrombidium deliense]
MTSISKEEFLLALQTGENYGTMNPAEPFQLCVPPKLKQQETLSVHSAESISSKFSFPEPVQAVAYSSSGGFDNPCFETESATHTPNPAGRRSVPSSPGVLPSENPVMAPRKRKVSHLIPAYLRRRGSNINADGVAVAAINTDSTQNLQPYSIINNESFPSLKNYLKFPGKRPSKDELSDPGVVENAKFDESERGLSIEKFGWFEGVFVRTCVNLLGVMLFMRMGWMAGQAGIILAVVQIILATLITCLTTLSMNALCTNGDIGAGGIYSMISRSLGPEAGAVIGIIFAFTNAAFVGLNLIGAAEAIVQIGDHFGFGITSNPINDIRIIGFIFLVIIALIPIISLQFEAKTQSFFLILLLICIMDYFIGALIPPNLDQQSKGFVGWKMYAAKGNLWPKWDGPGVNFFSVFGVFFPSVTPIFTGACMSGDLKDPATAIPKGTFLSIAATSLTYFLFIIFTGCTIVSYATGDPSDIGFNNASCFAEKCEYGLINDYNTVAISSGLSHVGLEIEPFIYAGILAASLSSALGCYMAAPRIFQSFAEDRLLPYISWFAKGYGPANDPRRGYLLTFIVAVIFTAIGDLNRIAPYISNFYLASYFLVNVTCFHAAWVNMPSFRPSFRYFNKWISLMCGALCFALMFLLDWISALLSVVLMVIIWVYMATKSPTVNWGTTSEAQLFNLAHSSSIKLYWAEEHVKNYRPKILLLSGNPSARPALVDMAWNITKDSGLLFLAHIKSGEITYDMRVSAIEAQKVWMRLRKVKAFYVLTEAKSLEEGVKKIAPITGLGRLRPNMIMMGYKTNWHECTESDLRDYFNIIHFALDMKYSLIIFRLQEGFDFSDFFTSVECDSNNTGIRRNRSFPRHLDVIQETQESTVKSLKDFIGMAVRVDKIFYNNNKQDPIKTLTEENPTVPRQVINSVNQFQRIQKEGTIDVWWLYDTGGIAMLVAWILRNNNLWKNSKIRVFTVIADGNEIEKTKYNLIDLLQKFRIPFSDVTVLTDSNPPSDETKLQFRDVIADWIEDEENPKFRSFSFPPTRITKNELITLKELTNRHIRLRELLLQYSVNATLIVMSLPMPVRGVCSAPLFMAWLEMLTQNMPPFLLVRGNHTNVLTFYC